MNGMNEKLDDWCRERGITCTEASRRLRIGQATLSRIREGYPPTLRIAARIVRATDGGIGYEDLLGPMATKELRGYKVGGLTTGRRQRRRPAAAAAA